VIEFDLDRLHLEGDAALTTWDGALLGVVAHFAIARQGVILWDEVEVPILELADHLRRWLTLAAVCQQSFTYQSMESDEPALLWCRPSGVGWSVGAGAAVLAEGLTFEELQGAAE
jgi:hypothetical protein